MEVAVCVNQVLDTRLPIRVTERGVVVQSEPSPIYLFSLADRCALEEALRLRGAVANTRITAITTGPSRAEAVLVECVARGVDRAVHLVCEESTPLDAFWVASILGTEIRKRGVDLVLCGNRVEDEGSSEVGPALAEFLDIAQVTDVVRLRLSISERRLVAERKLERGCRQVVETNLPALVTIDSAAGQPRYVTRRAIARGTKRLMERGEVINIRDAGTLGDGPVRRKVVEIRPPTPRPKRIARPDTGLSAEDRLAVVMGAIIQKKPTPRGTSGSESLADEIIAFLKERGLLE